MLSKCQAMGLGLGLKFGTEFGLSLVLGLDLCAGCRVMYMNVFVC